MPRIALADDEIEAFRGKAAAAAMHLFAEQGYDAVTMRAVAAALGVSAMTPYRYLANKDELFSLVRAEAFRRFADRLEAALARGGAPVEAARGAGPRPKAERRARASRPGVAPAAADVIDRLLVLKRAYIRFALDEPDAYRIMFEVRAPEPTHLEPEEVERESRRAFGCLHRTVAEAVEDGELDGDPLTIAHLAWASVHGLVSLHLAGRLGSGRTLAQLAAIDFELPAFARPETTKKRSRR